ncbi:hypothetical protein [Hoeflea sp. TYP-13]|uniref:hypothetical protein n=1 Tax=Hoeflea sp. TYP-13 TaxID=3230023 RepID=UPI0034C61486
MGELTGYDTNCGFVPIDESHPVFRLLMEQIRAGELAPTKPRGHDPAEKVERLILCKIFDRRWDHIIRTIERPFQFTPHSDAQSITVGVRIRNLPDNPGDMAEVLGSAFSLSENSLPDIKFIPLQLGVIEVEIEVSKLQKLFRNSRPRVLDDIKPFLEDALAEHFIRSGRRESQGPSVEWLISYAHYFLTAMFAEVANMAVLAFTTEYGGTPPGYLQEATLLRSSLVLARMESGVVRLHSFQHQPSHSFELSDWRDGTAALSLTDPTKGRRFDFWDVASRIQRLLTYGFAAEAIVVANALIEALLRQSFVAAAQSSPQAVEVLRSLGHRQLLEILSKLALEGAEPGFERPEFREFVKAAREIYSVRNNYGHELLLPVEHKWSTVELDRLASRLLRYIVDPHTSSLTMGALRSLAYGTSRSETIALVVAEALDRRPRDC